MSGRHIGAPCSCSCFDKIGLHKIQTIFNAFWQLGDYNLQNAYLSKLVHSNDVKRTYVKGRPSQTLRRIEYNIMHNNEKYYV